MQKCKQMPIITEAKKNIAKPPDSNAGGMDDDATNNFGHIILTTLVLLVHEYCTSVLFDKLHIVF